jgi:hypothetical protein
MVFEQRPSCNEIDFALMAIFLTLAAVFRGLTAKVWSYIQHAPALREECILESVSVS